MTKPWSNTFSQVVTYRNCEQWVLFYFARCGALIYGSLFSEMVPETLILRNEHSNLHNHAEVFLKLCLRYHVIAFCEDAMFVSEYRDFGKHFRGIEDYLILRK